MSLIENKGLLLGLKLLFLRLAAAPTGVRCLYTRCLISFLKQSYEKNVIPTLPTVTIPQRGAQRAQGHRGALKSHFGLEPTQVCVTQRPWS